MKRFYTFTPKNTKKTKFNSKEEEYIRTISRSIVAYVIITAISFFGFIAIFSNINNVWGFFRGKEIYTEEDVFDIPKPFIKVNSEYTKESKVDIEGVSQEGYKIILYKNDQEILNTVADNQDKFNFNDVEINAQDKAKTYFYAISKDKNGKESPKSNTITVTFDKTKPKIEVTYPEKDAQIKDFSRTLEVKGTTEPDTVVTINDRATRINLNNEFSATIRLEDGENIIKVIAKDKANNETKIEIPVRYEKIDD